MTWLPLPDPALHDVGINNEERGINQVRLLQHYGLTPATRLLEIGCGLGRLAYELRDHFQDGGTYAGFDIGAEAIEWLNAEYAPRLPGFRFDLLDVQSTRYRPHGDQAAAAVRFPYDDDAFDLACAFEVFMHVELDGVANYLAEVARVLRPGGVGVMTFMAIWDPDEVPTYAGRPFAPIGGGVHTRFPERAGVSMAYQDHLIRQTVAEAGLALVDTIEGRWHHPWDEPTEPGHNCDVYVVTPA